jgi:hypothetical protein
MSLSTTVMRTGRRRPSGPPSNEIRDRQSMLSLNTFIGRRIMT